MPWLGSLLAVVLLFVNTAHWMPQDLQRLRSPRRFWEDLSIAVSRHLATNPQETLAVGSWRGQAHIDTYMRRVLGEVKAAGIEPWQFWRTVPMHRFSGYEVLQGRPSDDAGRAGLLTFGFRILGGVAPFLLPWLGALAAIPLLAWAGHELSRVGSCAAFLLFSLAFSSSAFVVEVLTLPYSAVGSCLLGLLALVALAGYAVLGRPSPLGLLVRTLAAAVVFAIATLCRGGAILLLPGFALALAIGAMRIVPVEKRAGWFGWIRNSLGWGLLLTALLVIPYWSVAPTRHHEVWLGIWEGLGDFDRTKGHYWDDPFAKEVLTRAGREAPRKQAIWADALQHEAFWRDRVISDITGDPVWYLGILGRRLTSTVSLTKLWPFQRPDGLSFAPRSTLHEGAMDDYWNLTTTVDVFGMGGWRREIRVGYLIAPTLLLGLLWLAGRALPLLRKALCGLGPRLLVLACLSAASLVSPVLITTASGIEPQAFALTYLLGAGFLLDMLVLSLRSGRSGPVRK